MRAIWLTGLVVWALAASGAPALALDKIKIGTSGNSIIWTIIEMGREAKTWEALGLEVEHIALAGDAPMQQALASGSIDFGCGSGPAMGYHVKGVPAIAVAALAGPPYSMTLAGPMNSTIASFDDLKGKRVGITSSGSLSDWLVREVSRQKGWGPDGIEILPLGAERTRLVALKSGDLDASVVADQNAYSYEENNAGRMVLSFGDLVKDFHAHVLFAREDIIKTNPDLVRRVLKGWLQTVAWMRGHREAGIPIAAKAINVSEAAVAKAWDNELRMISDDGAFNPAAIETIRRSLPELGMLDRAPDAASLYDGTFTPVRVNGP